MADFSRPLRPPVQGYSSAPATDAADGVIGAAGSITNVSFIARLAAADTAVQVQAVPVQAGERVYIRPLPGNKYAVKVAQYSMAAVFGPFDYVGISDAEREFPVRNTGTIYIAQEAAAFQAGDGIAVNIRKGV